MTRCMVFATSLHHGSHQRAASLNAVFFLSMVEPHVEQLKRLHMYSRASVSASLLLRCHRRVSAAGMFEIMPMLLNMSMRDVKLGPGSFDSERRAPTTYEF